MTSRLGLPLPNLPLALCCLVLGCSPASSPVSGPGSAAAEPDETEAAAPEQTNRLAGETSPYLLLHAHNPVDWYPWGPDALQKAKRENKPIFLSIGYSSCHWCHVMERESFMDEEIAAFLNEHFVCIKVDREERPDIDKIYMTALQTYLQLSGSGGGGGWPLSMFLLPDGRPFFGGTYFPARDGDRGAAVGFLTLIQRIHKIWTESPDRIEKDAEVITRFVKQELESRRPVALTPVQADVLDETLAALKEQYDAEYGGFGYNPADPRRPKFPEPSNLVFLTENLRRTESAESREMLLGTLEKMALGGIRDHLGGGFHRYSVDRFWKIPHFEKMLYDNGQLASVYAEAYALTGRADFKRVTEQLLAFVSREMTSDSGGFYAALDAESEQVEGKFYRWTKEEVAGVLGEKDFELFAAVYGLDGPPNFEEEYYVPQLARPLAELAEERGLSESELNARLEPMRKKLLAVRNERPRPMTDTKVLTAWNGLMIRGLADAGRLLDEPSHVAAAGRAADFILANLRSDDGRLYRTYAQGEAKLNAYLDDYAFFINGLIGLYRASDERRWLDAADQLQAKQLELFWDDEAGGFFFTSDDHETLLARSRNPIDGARPAGGSVSVENLLFLARELDRPGYRENAARAIQAVGNLLNGSPSAAPRMAAATAVWLDSLPPEPKGKP